MIGKIRIHPNQIQFETLRAILIKMPSKSRYSGYVYWIPKRFLRQNYITLNSDFDITLESQRYGKKIVINLKFDDLLEIYGIEIEHEEFGDEILDDLKD